jgi:hypothetical protein
METEAMRQLFPKLNYTYPTDAYASPVSDIEQDNIRELQIGYYAGWQFCNFPESVLPAIQNITAFEDAFSIVPTPVIPDEANSNDSQVCFVTFVSPQKHNRIFAYLQPANIISLYGSEINRIALTSPRSRFFPDFYKIKTVVAQIVGQRLRASTEQHSRFPTIIENIPLATSAEVIREAEEIGIMDSLETIAQLIQKSYSAILRSINVALEHDPEISDRKTIRFTLTVSGKPEAILENEASFKRDLYSQVDVSVLELITITYKLEK